MSGAKEYLQVKFLKTLEPLGSLSVDKLEEIANKSKIEELPPGRLVFRQGEKDNRSIYLLSGQLELQVTGNLRSEVVKAKTVDARYPIAQEWPRPSTCRTKTNAVLLHIDSDLLEILLSEDPSGTYEVTEIGVEEDPESDWMLRFLQSPAFLQLPTENIQSILMHLDEIEMKAGTPVIKQGETDDWYYIVKKGKCAVSRRPAPKADEVRLALLGPGDGFGEEALITQGKRNATVTMKEDGILMRLAKTHFHELLVKPMVRSIDHSTMMEKVKAGAALIDVRTNKEFSENGIKGAQNIPLSMLRIKAKDLNATREHIVYCEDGNQSAAAAFLLAQQSLSVYLLEGGLSAQSKPFSPSVTRTAPTRDTVTAKTTPPPAVEVKTATSPASTVDEKEFQNHKRHAKQQAERANQFEQAHKKVEARSDHLREKADALRAQADRLASKTANAEAERKKAEAEIEKVKQETLKQRDQILASAKQEIEKEKQAAKQKEEEVNRLRQEAEEARRRADAELKRIHDEANAVKEKQAQLDEEMKRNENEKLQAARAAEIARVVAKQEAEKVKNEAETIRQQALQEAEAIREQMENRRVQMAAEEAARQEKALEEAKRKAEMAIAESTKAAEEARRQAALEAEAIRKQALKEAESLRLQLAQEKQMAAEQAARSKAEEQLRRQELEEERLRAIDEARRLAEQEADEIRSRALQEAQIKAREAARRQTEIEAETIRQQTIEEVKRKAIETARLEAEEAAEAIRREALNEVNRLRSEMEATRKLVESETSRARAQMEAKAAQTDLEEQELARAAEEAASRAARQAEQRRQAALRQQEEAARLQAEELARQKAEEESRRQLALEQARVAEESARHKAEEAQRKALQEQAQRIAEERQHKAKQMAESIKQKLTKQDAMREQYAIDQSGPKLAKAKLHVIRDKTVLEGEEDIFVFKAPSERPPSKEEAEKLLREAEAQLAEKSRKELPSFDVDYADDEPADAVINTDSEFSDSILLELDNITASSAPVSRSTRVEDEFVIAQDQQDNIDNTRKSKKTVKRTSLIALAASVVVMVTISAIAITRPTYLDVDQIANNEKQTDTPQRGLAAIRTQPKAVTTDNRAVEENRVKDEADREFQKMLDKWQKQQSTN